MKVHFDISGWREDYSYQKYDTVFFTGDYKNSQTGCLQVQSGYYYASDAQAGDFAAGYDATVASQSPTGSSTKWTRSFPSSGSYGSSAKFTVQNDRIDFGDGYYKLTPKSHNNIDVTYALNFSSRTDKESKAILHFLGHRFETPYSGAQRTDDGIQTLTGFNYSPFPPYNQTGLFHCESFNHSQRFPDVNDIDAEFIDDTNTPTNWKNRIINLDSTSGHWEESIVYSKFDVVYYSGHNIANHSGYYYYSGDTATTSSQLNKPKAGGTVWTKDDFFFKPTMATSAQTPRMLKTTLANEYTERYSDGLNSNLLDLNLSFDGRDNKEGKALVHFLINKQGYQSFKFTPPKPYEQTTKYFVCEEWADNVVFDENRGVTAKFQEYPLNLFQQTVKFETYVFDTGSPDMGAGAQVIGNAAEGFHPPDGKDVYQADFGTFMTGFSSGSGFYLVNSGNQRIVSDLYLSGENQTTGLYKFKTSDNPGLQIINDDATHARYTLDKFESGIFEVEFATTGKGSLVGTASAPFQEGIMLYERGHGTEYADANTGPNDPISQLYINTTDEFGFSDPSGTIKIDLTGNAEAFGPGPITDFTVDVDPDSNFLVTGGWKFSEPFTATGVLLQVSGIDHRFSNAKDPATGLLEDFNPYGDDHKNFYLEPFKNGGVQLNYPDGRSATLDGLGGFFYFYGKPGKTYYFRARSQNIDLMGGNINGGTARTVLSTDFIHADAAPSNTNFNVFIDEDRAIAARDTHGKTPVSFIMSQERYGRSMLANVNLSEFASGELLTTRAALNNAGRLIGEVGDITTDSFTKVIFHFGQNTTAFSDNPATPAVQTGPAIDKHGTALPIEIRIPVGSNIIGAGGSGAHVVTGNNAPPASFHVSGIQSHGPYAESVDSLGAGNNGRSNARVGSLIELGGIGPISQYYTSGKIDGKYFMPNGIGPWESLGQSDNATPLNGEHGGTALHLDSTYAGVKVNIYNLGFIGGGGGGGGAGGTRMSNIANMALYQEGVAADGLEFADEYLLKLRIPSAGFRTASSQTVGGQIKPAEVRLLPHIGAQSAENHPPYGTNAVRAIRPGGGGGGGCGLRLQPSAQNQSIYGIGEPPMPNAKLLTVEGADDILVPFAMTIAPALGGRGAKPVTKFKSRSGGDAIGGVGDNWTTRTSRFYVKEPSHPGKPSKFTLTAHISDPMFSHGGAGGHGAHSLDPTAARSFYLVDSPSGLRTLSPVGGESAYNGGGMGGFGGSWGMDGLNGEHPVQAYMDRYISAEKGPEPRNFGYGGSGGLCIETNGAKLEFLPTGVYFQGATNLADAGPCSGQDDKSILDAKNSDLYRNIPGRGNYLTPKIASFTVPGGAGSNTMVKVASETRPVGLVSGLHGRKIKSTDNYRKGAAGIFTSDGEIHSHPDYAGPSFEGCDRNKANSSNAISDATSGENKLPWKAFNQTIDGAFNDYTLFDKGGFPYYLIYDFGVGNEVAVSSFSITSAGASASHFTSDNQKEIFGEVYSPTDFELRATNTAPDAQGSYTVSNAAGDSTIASHMLDANTDLLFSTVGDGWAADKGGTVGKISPGSAAKMGDHRMPHIKPIAAGSKPQIQLITDNAGQAPTVELAYADVDGGRPDGNEFIDYVCVPGLTRQWDLTPYLTVVEGSGGRGIRVVSRKIKKYRYYILKIIAADNFPGEMRKKTSSAYPEAKLKASYPFPSEDGKCKIADIGFRGYNKHYAGFISIRS